MTKAKAKRYCVAESATERAKRLKRWIRKMPMATIAKAEGISVCRLREIVGRLVK